MGYHPPGRRGHKNEELRIIVSRKRGSETIQRAKTEHRYTNCFPQRSMARTGKRNQHGKSHRIRKIHPDIVRPKKLKSLG